MAVKIVIKETGETLTGKFASIDSDKIGLFSGIISDKKGGFRGCGEKQVFDAAGVTVTADDPDREIERIEPDMTVRELPELPVFRSPGPFVNIDSWSLRVDGLVAHPLALSFSEVRALPNVNDVSPFECMEGWRVPRNHWRGVAVGTLLDRACPLPQARFVTFHSGEFIMSLTLEEAQRPRVLLAYDLNGAPLAAEHGAPLRLVAPGKECFYGVKWVQQVELAEEPTETGRAIALRRIQRPAPAVSRHEDKSQEAGDNQ